MDPDGMPQEWETLARLAGIVSGQGPDADIEALDGLVIGTLLGRELGETHSRIAGRDQAEILDELEPRRGHERILDLLLRVGPYGDAFGDDPEGLTLARLEESPHGIDLGPLEPRIPEVLRTPSGKVELAPPELVADVPRLKGALTRANGHMVLVGRRQLRSNNSWMHNLDPLVKGKDRCTAHVHPDDARRLGLTDGGLARLRSRAGEIEAPVEITDAVMPGVVSVPHGWGHDAPGVQLRVASAHAGVNSNILADDQAIEPVSGNAVLNGIPIEVAAAG
jgi:anaerobic selenocysteine-containing dehydrogenase